MENKEKEVTFIICNDYDISYYISHYVFKRTLISVLDTKRDISRFPRRLTTEKLKTETL